MPREKSLDQLLLERDKYFSKYMDLEKKIKSASTNVEEVKITDWKGNAIKCIITKGIFSQTIPILECLIYPNKKILENKAIKRKYVSNVAVALMKLTKDGILKKVQIEGYKGHFFGLPEWMNSNGTPNEKHMDETLKQLILKKK